MRPKVSALIPCYEMAHCVANAVESVLAQEGDPVEIVVVDDGSKADPGPALARFGDRVRLVRQENGGAASARNRAASAATGEWLAFLDADDRWLPEKTRLTLEALAARPGAAFAYGRAQGFDEDGEQRTLGPPPVTPTTKRNVFLSLLGDGNTIPMLTGVVSREAFHAIGGLDGSLRTGEDYDLWLRLAERYELAYVDAPVAVYRMHAGGDVMGDVDRWVTSIEALHAEVVARYPGDDEVLQAATKGNAAVRISRGFDRLRDGDREGAREDFRAAQLSLEHTAQARRLLRHSRVPTRLYLGIRRLLARPY